MTVLFRLTVRHPMFKTGVGFLLLALIFFLVGYSSPAWKTDVGLWLSCTHGFCASNVVAGQGPWFEAVRVLETLALVCFLVAAAVLLYQDVLKSPPPPENKAVEIITGIAALFGFIGVIVFGAYSEYEIRIAGYNKLRSGFNNDLVQDTLEWGFSMATLACILAVIAAVLIGISRARHAHQTADAYDDAASYTSQPSQRGPPREEYEYDRQGDSQEKHEYDRHGNPREKREYDRYGDSREKYEYDRHGNPREKREYDRYGDTREKFEYDRQDNPRQKREYDRNGDSREKHEYDRYGDSQRYSHSQTSL